MFAATSFAQKATIHGTITDAASGETMISATVYCPELGIGTATNSYGFYSLTLPKGRYTVVISYLGYDNISKDVDVEKDMRLDIKLSEARNEIGEVVVTRKTPAR